MPRSRYGPLAFSILLIIAASSVSGCNSNSPDALIKENIRIMNQMADELEAGNVDAVQTYQPRLQEVAKKLQDLELSTEELQRLQLKYQKPIQEAAQRMAAGMAKAMGNTMSNLPMKMPSFPK